jgi:two-component system, NtrC family, sensor kinase
MRVATRLMLILVGTVMLIMFAYMLVSHRQRLDLLRDGISRDTETLSRSLQAGINHALRGGQLDGISQMLDAAVADKEVVATVVLGPAGEVMAGEAANLSCLRQYVPEAALASGEARGWAQCSQGVYWVALPLVPPAASLLVAQRGVLLERSVAAAVRRQLLLMLALLGAIALLLPLILRGMLMAPLAEIMSGIRALGERGEMPRLQVRDSAGELADVAAALNEMADQLSEKRRELIGGAEEKLALEQRLREAEKFAVIGRLSGGLAHELGSPLSVIGIRAQAIQFAPDSSATTRQHAEIIHGQVRRVTDFIQSLLHIAQQQGIVFNPVEITDLLRDVVAEIGPRVEAEHVLLELELPDGPVEVRGEKTLLRHAVRNLVRNSVHALQDHHGERRIRVRADRTEHGVRVLVEDTGPGIPPAKLDSVFQPFYTTKGIGKGMGLGLPITRSIIEEHGGEVYLENLKHRGLRAVLVLPVNGVAATPDAAAAAAENGGAEPPGTAAEPRRPTVADRTETRRSPR